ncbi:SGNH/GDSL hydrolase family protein [Glaciecola sp. SC05]|uniref:SGNH/GDSL hydrolase family protein n=1 Tax=Glaciecola sp. SC05 TaxID=1987355 RepID=UPI0035280A74
MLYKLVALLTFPVLLIQGKRVKQNALKLPEAAGPRQGNANNKALPTVNILIIGDSSAAGVGVDHQDDAIAGQLANVLKGDINVSWQLIAKTGAQTKDMVAMLSAATISSPIDIVITSLGVNDVTSLQRSSKWLVAQDKLHEYCLSTLNAKHIIVSGMPPLHRFPLLPQPLRWIIGSRAKQLDKQQLKKIKKQPNVSHQALPFDLGANAMAIDGFHPGAVAYQVWAASLREPVLQLNSHQP